ncbi:MAG: hypothetical protein AMXMBFR64_30630 [Myxococcales bacterium]
MTLFSSQNLAMAQWAVAATLLGLMAACVPLALMVVRREVAGWGRRSVWTLAGAVLVGAVLRLLAPKLIATVFIGYRATAEAIRLFPVPHYGIGTATFYNLVFSFLPADHLTLMWTNTVIGILTLPLLAVLAGRLLREPRAALVFAWIVALLPLLVRNDTSDANNVPVLLWLCTGLLLWLDGLDGSRWSAVAAMPALMLVAISRPEQPLFLTVLLPLVTVMHGVHRAPWRDPVIVVAALLGAALLVPHVLHVLQSIDLLRSRGSLPGPLLMMPSWEPHRHAVLHPLLYPPPLLVLALVPLILPSPIGRLRVLALIAIALFAHVVTLSDCDWANAARVGVPEALFVTMLASLGAVRVVDRVRAGRLVAAGLIGALVAGTAARTAIQLWQPTNERTEEALVEEATALLPGGPLTLLKPGAKERDERFTHLFFPDYRLGPEQHSMAITEFLERPDWRVPVYAFLGLRCYARFRPWGLPAPEGTQERRSCAELRASMRLEPLFERTVPNHGDVWIPYYGTAPELLVGFYRVYPDGEP